MLQKDQKPSQIEPSNPSTVQVSQRTAEDWHAINRKIYVVIVVLLQILFCFIYGFYVRVLPHTDSVLNHNYYPFYQDVNVMMLIGFGFLMTFIKTYSWSALAYTFFTNAIVVQLYLIISAFWVRVFHHGNFSAHIQITQQNLTAASYCVASVLIAFGALLGRISALQLLILGVIQTIFYSLNEEIIYNVIKIYDVGGSTGIHTFGAYTGLAASFVLGRKTIPAIILPTSYTAYIFPFIGTFFLWMFWPSFNAGFFSQTGYQKSIVIVNTVIALTGSCMSTFATSTFLRGRFHLEQILNATLAGGVIVGASAGLLTNVGGALVLGILAGFISSMGFEYLTNLSEDTINLFDSCGVQSLHGIPGFLGGLASAVVISAYGSSPLQNTTAKAELGFYSNTFNGRTFNAQGGIQVAGTFISLGIGLATGIIVGLFLVCLNRYNDIHIYNDRYEFEMPKQLRLLNRLKQGDGHKLDQIKKEQQLKIHGSMDQLAKSNHHDY